MADAIDYNAKWDAYLYLTLRRFVYSSLAGALDGSPVTCWASIAFAVGVGVGSAYTKCSQILYGSHGNLSSPKVLDTPAPQANLIEHLNVTREATERSRQARIDS